MAKYTMILGECLNVMTGHQYNIYNVLDISALVQASKRSVFMHFPIWDEAYRPILESKILTHYLYREIGFESMAMFIFMLNRKLNEIMPYYNEMYKTLLPDLLKEDWFDYFEDYLGGLERNEAGEGKEGEASQSITRSEISQTSSDTKSNSSVRTPDLTEQEESHRNDTTVAAADKTGKTNEQSNRDFNTYTSVTYGKKENRTETEDGTITYGKITKKTGDDRTHVTGKTTDRFSDTPQGSLRNIENNTYLTNANINDVDTTTVVTYGSILTESGSDTTEGNSEGETALSGTDKTNERGIDGNTVITDVTSHEDNTSATEGSTDRSKKSTGTETTEDSGTTNGEEETSSVSGTETVGGKETSDKKNTKENSVYTKHIHGKNPDNYVETIMEWREGILNIDMMVIEELEVLFMAMY